MVEYIVKLDEVVFGHVVEIGEPVRVVEVRVWIGQVGIAVVQGDIVFANSVVVIVAEHVMNSLD